MFTDKHSDKTKLSSFETLSKSDKLVDELITSGREEPQDCIDYHDGLLDELKRVDGEIYNLITNEYRRLKGTLQLIAAENICSRAVLAALGSVVQNKTAEGFPGARVHAGCEVVDQMEILAVKRAKEAFGAQYANVQPHSGSQANQIVITALLRKNDKILSLGLEQGGHFSHGSPSSFTGRFFEVEHYYVDRKSFRLDYEAIRQKAVEMKPKLIICGASAYSRAIDFEKFRAIADEVGAYLLADISHISGLILAGAHQSPINLAHFITTSTYKPGGPRGGLILMGDDKNGKIKVDGKNTTFWKLIDNMTFPGVQGTPYLNNIAAKAVFFKETLSPEYKQKQFKIIGNARALANNLMELGYDVLTGGTDNHMVLVNIANFRDGLTGLVAEKCLEDCGIIVNKISLPFAQRQTAVPEGIRLGTPVVTKTGMGTEQMDIISNLIDAVLKNVTILSDSKYEIDESFMQDMRDKVERLCERFPLN